MKRAMVTVVNITGTTDPVEYVLTPTAVQALKQMGYELKTPKQPETDGT